MPTPDLGPAVHHGVNVSEMETALGFYRDELGLPVRRRFEMSATQGDIVGVDGCEGEIAMLGPPDAGGVELLAYDAPPGGSVHDRAAPHDVGVAHVCFEVADLEATLGGLAGVEPVGEPARVASGRYIAYLRDPDGNLVELQEPPADGTGE